MIPSIVVDIATELMSRPKLYPLDLELLRSEKERAVPFRIQSNEVKGAWRVNVKKVQQLTSEELKLLESEGIKTSVHEKVRVMQDEFIPNPRYPSYTISKFWNVAKGATRVMTGIGLFMDASSLNSEYQASRESGDYSNTQREGARIAVGWTGAYVAGTAGVKLGVAGCAPIAPPYGSAVCGLVGGLVGSIAGYQYGGEITAQLFDENQKRISSAHIFTDSVSEPAAGLSKHKTGTKNIMFRLFETSAEQDKKIQEEFDQRDAKLAENYKKEREKEEERAAQFRDKVASMMVTGATTPHHQTASHSTEVTTSTAIDKVKPKKQTQSDSISSTETVPHPDKIISLSPTEEDKQTAEFLIVHGASPTQVVSIYQDKNSWQIAKDATQKFFEHEQKLEGIKNQEQCIQIFQGVGEICNALSQCKSAELRHIGKIGTSVMTALVHVETLWGVFSGGAGSLATVGIAGSFFAIGGLVAAGIGLLNALTSSDDEEQQRQLMESLNMINQHISTVRHEMHERFDRVECAIGNVAHMMASYCNHIIQNQKMLFEQNKRHMELSLQGFRSMTAILGDFRAENKSDHQKIFKQFSYLISLKEKEPLQKLKESIDTLVMRIKDKTQMSASDNPTRKEMILDQLSDLKSQLGHCASPDYNGKERFSLLQHDPQQAAQFLSTRNDNRDDALGFLAEEIESITGKKLSAAKIKKEKLPVTALWCGAIHEYVALSSLPICAEHNRTPMLNEIKEQSDNLLLFLQYIKSSGVINQLLQRHTKYLHDLQQALHQIFIQHQKLKPGIKDKKSDDSQPRILTVREYCLEGAAKVVIDKILYKIDYNYLLLNRFAYLGGYPQAFQKQLTQLDRSINLLEQSFNFNEVPVEAYGSQLSDASMSTMGDHIYRYSYHKEQSETPGALLLRDKIIFIASMVYSEDFPGGANSCSLGVNEYDLRTNQCTYGKPVVSYGHPNPAPPFDLVKYKGNFHQSLNHGWASTHIMDPLAAKPKLVFFTGGSGYVCLYDMTTQQWESIDTAPILLYQGDTSNNHVLSFTVPLPKYGAPNTTSYTHMLHNRYLHITKLKWQGRDAPGVTFDAIDLIEKRRLYKHEVSGLFSCYDYSGEIRCRLTGCDLFLMSSSNVTQYKYSDDQHLYLYKDSDGSIVYYENWYSPFNKSTLDDKLIVSIKGSLIFNQPADNPAKCTDQRIVDIILAITNNKGFTELSSKSISPNQFYITTITPVGYFDALIYGILQPMTHVYTKIDRLKKGYKQSELKFDKSTLAIALEGGQLKAFWHAAGIQSQSISEESARDIIQTLPGEGESTYNREIIANIASKFDCRHQLNVSFHYKPIEEGEPQSIVDKKAIPYGERNFSIAAKVIHQTRSEVLYVDGENKLFIPTTFTDYDGMTKLAIISVDYFKKSYESKVFSLPSIHPNSDWQAMRTVAARIGDRDHLLLTLLSPEYQILIFSYDPKTQVLSRLTQGPQLKFIRFEDMDNPTLRVRCIGGTGWEGGLDEYLLDARKQYPGFYPVRPIEIRVSNINNVSTLHIAYPTVVSTGALNYQMHVASIPLTPHLHFKPLPTVPSLPAPALTTTPTPAAIASASSSAVSSVPAIPNMPANHLGIDLFKTQLLLSLPQRLTTSNPTKSSVEVTPELPKENVLKPPYHSCKDIHELFSAVVSEVKLSEVTKKSVEDNLKAIIPIIDAFNENEKQTLDILKKALPQLQDIFKTINKIDGFLKLSQTYSSGIGVNINRQIEQLKEEIEVIKNTINKSSASMTSLRTNGIFSGGAQAEELSKRLLEMITKNIDAWSKLSPPASTASQKEELDHEVKKWGLTCKPTSEDGNCFFHAIADQLILRTKYKSETHATLREKATEHIRSHQEEYKDFIDGNFNSFINANKENHAWADNVMIVALSRALKKTIVIVRSDHAEPTIFKHPKQEVQPPRIVKDRPILYIGYEVGLHYQSLVGESGTLLAKVKSAKEDNLVVPKKQVTIQTLNQ